jgi:hypothetical protein
MATSCGSLTKDRILYSSAFRAPAETRGHIRLAQQTVRVNVAGTDTVDEEFSPAAGYFLIHWSDLAGFVRAARRLAMSDEAGKLLTEEEVEARLKQ